MPIKLKNGELFSSRLALKFGELVGVASIGLFLIEVSSHSIAKAFMLDCDGAGHWAAFPDICKPTSHGVVWDNTVFLTEHDAIERARNILTVVYPSVDLTPLVR